MLYYCYQLTALLTNIFLYKKKFIKNLKKYMWMHVLYYYCICTFLYIFIMMLFIPIYIYIPNYYI